MEIIKLPDTASTNDFLLGLNTDQELCVVTDYQSAGKGMGTNTWESEPGKNLLFSILLHPTWLPINKQYLLSMAEAVAIVEVLGEGFEIKWPNDIYYGDKKLSGTRIDVNLQGNSLKDVIIGTGINVNQEVFHSDAPNPISLKNITGTDHDREVLLHKILERFSYHYNTLADSSQKLSTFNFQLSIQEYYHNHLYRRTGLHTYSDKSGTFQAEIVSVANNGIITLRRTDSTLSHYEFKELKFC